MIVRISLAMLAVQIVPFVIVVFVMMAFFNWLGGSYDLALARLFDLFVSIEAAMDPSGVPDLPVLERLFAREDGGVWTEVRFKDVVWRHGPVPHVMSDLLPASPAQIAATDLRLPDGPLIKIASA